MEYGWRVDRTVAHWLELLRLSIDQENRGSNLVLPYRTVDKFVHSKFLTSLTYLKE